MERPWGGFGGRGTSYNGLCRNALCQKGTFFRPHAHKRVVRMSLVEIYEREGKSFILLF